MTNLPSTVPSVTVPIPPFLKPGQNLTVIPGLSGKIVPIPLPPPFQQEQQLAILKEQLAQQKLQIQLQQENAQVLSQKLVVIGAQLNLL